MKDVRCKRNPYNTLLFRYSEKGIFVFCKDCYNHAENKKGTQHLITWSQLLGLMISFVFGVEPEKLPEGMSDGVEDNNSAGPDTGP